VTPPSVLAAAQYPTRDPDPWHTQLGAQYLVPLPFDGAAQQLVEQPVLAVQVAAHAHVSLPQLEMTEAKVGAQDSVSPMQLAPSLLQVLPDGQYFSGCPTLSQHTWRASMQ
jgi:hypothetical protein